MEFAQKNQAHYSDMTQQFLNRRMFFKSASIAAGTVAIGKVASEFDRESGPLNRTHRALVENILRTPNLVVHANERHRTYEVKQGEFTVKLKNYDACFAVAFVDANGGETMYHYSKIAGSDELTNDRGLVSEFAQAVLSRFSRLAAR